MTAAGRRAIRQRPDRAAGRTDSRSCALRDSAHGRLISYSRKVFIPPTPNSAATFVTTARSRRCRARASRSTSRPTRYSPSPAPARPPVAPRRCSSRWATSLSCDTLWRRRTEGARPRNDDFLSHRDVRAGAARDCLLLHANPGVMTREDIAGLSEVTASQGIMLESTSERLCRQGGVHYGSPG